MVASEKMDNDNHRYMKPVSEMSDVSEPRMRWGIARGSERKGHGPLAGEAEGSPQSSREVCGAHRPDRRAGL